MNGTPMANHLLASLGVLALLAAIAAYALLLHSGGGGVLAAPRLQSTDATLSALNVSGGTRIGGLDPVFASGTTEYKSAVLHGTSRVTVTATANDSNATIAFTPSTDAHADSGHQVDLSTGENTITVTVTAEDTTSTETYTITVWRHPEIDGWLFRSKEDRSTLRRTTFSSGTSSSRNRFTTGPSEQGYTINAVQVWFDEIPDPPGNWTLEIRNPNEDSTVGSFHVSRTSWQRSIWEIPAREPFTLDANTEYVIRVEKHTGTWKLHIREAYASGAHSDSAYGWSGDNRVCSNIACTYLIDNRMIRFRLRGTAVDATAPALQTAVVDGDTLTLTYDEALDERRTPATSAFTVTSGGSGVGVDSVGVSGSEVALTLARRVGAGDTVTMTYTVPGSNAITNAGRLKAAAITSSQTVTNSSVANTDATLSALTISSGLDPAFDSATTSYTSAVKNSTDEVTVAATANDSNATFAITPADASNTDADHQVDLTVGENTITVTVTAEDTTSTETYTITVWRHPLNHSGGNTIFRDHGAGGDIQAQLTSIVMTRFTTGPSAEGYVVNATRVYLGSVPSPPGRWTLDIRKDSDNTVVGTFHVLGTTIRHGNSNFFYATSPIELDPNTTYRFRFRKHSGTWTMVMRAANSAGADKQSMFGWSMPNTVCGNDNCTASWPNRALQLRFYGSAKDTTAPALQTAEVNGDTLTLTYDEALDERETPATSAFAVTSDSSSVTVDSVDVSGSAVALTLASRVSQGDTVTMTYTVPGSNAITNAARLEAAAITSSQTVTNNTLPELSIANASAEEGDAMTFTVSLSEQDSNAVTVEYATSVESSDTATAGTDYTTTSGTLTIAANTDSNTFTVATTEDTTTEGDETFTVTLTSPSSNAALGTATATGTIEDDDQPTFSIAAADATEGSDVTFTVSLSPASTGATSVQYATSGGTATQGTDYTATSGTLSFAASDTSKTFTVATDDDNVDEDNETFTVTLTSPTGGAVLGTATAAGTINDNDTVAFVINNASDDEGATLTFEVRLNPLSAKQVTVQYATSNISAIAGEDYTDTSGTLTFAANARTRTFTVDTAGDTRDDIDRVFRVTLSNQSAGTLSQATGTGQIRDDDPEPTLSVGTPSALAEGNSGSKTMTFAVTLSAQSNKRVTVQYTTADGTATAGDDFTTASGTLTFAAQTTTLTQNIPVTIAGDKLDEADSDTFEMRLSSAVSASISTATATGTITDDDDMPAVDIRNADSGSGSNSESGNINFSVRLDDASGREVTVEYRTLTTGTATSGTDYTAKSGTLTFAAGVREKTISIAVLGDTLDEENETFTVRLSNPTNATLATADRDGTGTINDDDDPPVLSINDIAVDEGNADHNVTFTVTLDAQSAKQVTVEYGTSAGSATAPADFTAKTGTLTFAAGTTTLTQSIQVTVKGDKLDEHDETFAVKLSTPTNATLDGVGIGVAMIRDDDDEAELGISDAERTETDATSSLVFTVKLDEPSGKEVTVEYETSGGTAVEDTDYTATSGTLTFSAGATRQTFAVPITGDTLDEDDETFTVTLMNAVNAGVDDSTATGKIKDNDPLPALTIADADSGSGSNSESGNITFTVTLTPVSGRQVTVQYATLTTGRTAEATDYGAAAGTLTFAAGDTTKTFPVTVVDDTTDEDNETFTVRISSPSNATVATADRDATGTINDDDPPPGLSIDDAEVNETDATVAMTFTVTLSAASEKTVTVEYATSGGTATQGTDYTAKSGTLTFAPSVTTRTFTVSITGDNVQDSDPAETFTVTLSSASNAGITDTTGTGTINDDEGPSRLSIGDASVTEGDTGSKNLVFTVALLGDPTQLTITTEWATAEGTGATAATAGVDYTSASGTLTFAPPARSKTVTVPILGDKLDEHNETFTVTLSNENNADVAKATATGTITDNDPLPRARIHTELEIEKEDGVVELFVAFAVEGKDLKFPVTLSEASGRDVVLNYRTLDPLTRIPAAVPGEDYTAVTAGTVTFAAGETLKKITITTIDDSVSKYPGFLDVLLSLPSPAHAALARARTHGRISDNEATPTFSVDAATADEGDGTLNFTVTLTPASTNDTTVNFATLDSTAVQGVDYTARSGTLTFAANATSQTVSVPLRDDTLDEDDETFRLRLSDPSSGLQLGTSTATGTITDDDDPPAVSTVAVEARESAGTFQVPVTLGTASGRTVTIEWRTAAGTATAGEDFTAASGTLTFSAGDTSENAEVVILQDTTAEQDETFTLSLTSTDGTADVSSTTVTVTILDDEARPRLSIADATKSEDSSPMTFTVSLSVQSGFEVTVQWQTADGTATAPDDYTAVTAGTLTFAAGTTSVDIEVALVDDNVHDAANDETFTVRLFGAVNADIQRATATGTIIDDEGPPKLSIADAELAEGADTETSSMTFMVTLTGDPEGDVTVNYRTIGGTATQGTDYEAKTGTLTFSQSAGETSKNIEVVVRGDDDFEGDETFRVQLSNGRVDTETVPILVADATGTILDDDPGVSTAPASLAIREGGNDQYQVRLHTDPGATVTVDITSDNEDVTVSSDSLTFTTANWDTPQTVIVTVAQDGDSSNESARLTHDVTGYGTVTSGTPVNVSVTDDDARRQPPPPLLTTVPNRVPEFAEGETAARWVEENSERGTNIGSPIAATDLDGDTLTYALTGEDAAAFDIVSSTGQLRTRDNLDYETRSAYTFRVYVLDGKGAGGSDDNSIDDFISVTITVLDRDEDGTITFSETEPRPMTALTAELADPDGEVSDVTWVWERSTEGTAWAGIPGATSASYTPADGDSGAYLRVVASYTDPNGPSKSAMASLDSPVASRSLIERYDGNGDEAISRDEALQAVSDYFDGLITLMEVLAVINLYFESPAT